MAWPPTARRATTPFRNNRGYRPPAARALTSAVVKPLAADAPIAALDLFNDNPGHPAHVLAFDRDHRIGQRLDHLPLLRLGEDALDQLYLNQWHRLPS